MATIDQFVESLTKYRPALAEYYYTYGYNARSFSTGRQNAVMALTGQDDFDGEELLRGLDLPVLLIQGKDDALIQPQFSHHIARVLPKATLLEYEDCGHSTFLEQPNRFNQDVVTFIDAILQQA